MNISAFIDKNFHLTKNTLITLRKIENLVNEDVKFKNEYTATKACTAYINEIEIHHSIATSTCAEILGADELISTLKLQEPDEQIFMRFINSTSWSGRIYFDKSNNFLGLIIGRKKNIGWSTPPNWDGSEKMLEEYNITKH